MSLRLEQLIVKFGGVAALDGVTLEVLPGQLHGLIGPNGAGKTTVINAITGFVRPSGGSIHWDDKPLRCRQHELVTYGISRTFQAPAMFDELTAVENVMVGAHHKGRTGVVRAAVGTRAARGEERDARAAARQLLGELSLTGRVDGKIAELSLADLRRVELARCLISKPRLIMLDEPTAGLTAAEVAQYADKLRQLASGGTAIVVVEHNVPFIFGLCSAVSALDQGRVIASGDATAVRQDPRVIASYLGSDRDKPQPSGGRPRSSVTRVSGGPSHPDVPQVEQPALALADVSAGYGQTTVLHRITIHVGANELVSVFGRNGAGKSTLLGAITGSPRITSGRVEWHGRRIDGHSTPTIVRDGIGLVPQERGLIEGLTVKDNLRLSLFGARLSRVEAARRESEMLEKLPVLATRLDRQAGGLSGGERQMLSIAKALIRQPGLLLLDEPSIGLAPRIVDELQEIVAQLRDDGLPVLVVEQNVSWVVPLADRAYLLESGRIVSEGNASELASAEALAEQYLGKAAAHETDGAEIDRVGLS